MKKFPLPLLVLLIPVVLFSETIHYNDSWGQNGFSIKFGNEKKVVLNFSISSFDILPVAINGVPMHELALNDVFIPNNEGMPNLPGLSKFIAIS